jgi:hypothetical protein
VCITYCCNRVLSGKGRRVGLVRDLILFHASGEGSRGHEILHHVTALDLVLNGVSMVCISLLEELLDVVRGRPCLALAVSCSSSDAHHTRATR